MRRDAYCISGHEKYTHADGHDYSRGVRSVIVAVDIEDAIHAWREAHPRGVVYTVGHRGEVEVITSNAMKVAEGRQ